VRPASGSYKGKPEQEVLHGLGPNKEETEGEGDGVLVSVKTERRGRGSRALRIERGRLRGRSGFRQRVGEGEKKNAERECLRLE